MNVVQVGAGRQQAGVDAQVARQLPDPGRHQAGGRSHAPLDVVGRAGAGSGRRAAPGRTATASSSPAAASPCGTRPSMPRMPRRWSRLVGGWVEMASTARSGKDGADRPVLLGGGALPPRRHLLRHAAAAAAQVADLLDLPPRRVRVLRGAGGGELLPALLLGPRQPAGRLAAARVIRRARRRRWATSAAAYSSWAGGERALAPVGEPVALRQVDVEDPVGQRGERRGGEAEEPGRHLGVEQVLGHAAARPVEDLEVLAGGVGDHERRGLEDRAERPDVDGHRVDQRDAALPRHLEQRELGPVGALAVELGVEAELPRLDERLLPARAGRRVSSTQWDGAGDGRGIGR